MTYPVKYAPIRCPIDDSYDIIDTSFGGRGNVVCTAYTEEVAYRLTKFLNESEGYVYEP
jgi:hypothetical protein